MPRQFRDRVDNALGIHPGAQQHQKHDHGSQHGKAPQHHRPNLVHLRSHHRQEGQDQALLGLLYGNIIRVTVPGFFYACLDDEHTVRIRMDFYRLVEEFLFHILQIPPPEAHRQGFVSLHGILKNLSQRFQLLLQIQRLRRRSFAPRREQLPPASVQDFVQALVP